MRAIRFLIDLFSQRHGVVALVFFLLLSLLMHQAPVAIKESVVTSALSTIFYPAQLVVSSVQVHRSVQDENERLKEENAKLRQASYYASEGLQELERLRKLVRFDDKGVYPIVTARVVGHNPGRFLTTLVINRGSNHGLKENMPVFAMNGLVGKVTKVALTHSQVQLLLDPNLKLSVKEKRTRVVGFLESVDGQALSVLLPAHADFKDGDTLVTSGLGGIFPRGIPVGAIKNIRNSNLDVMRLVDVEPFQNLSMLEEVFVMLKEPDWVIRELLEGE